MHPDVNTLVKSDDIIRAHPDTTKTGGFADAIFFRGAVNVNAPFVRAAILFLQTAQPDYARDNRVSSASVGRNHFAGWISAFNDCANGKIVAEFPRNE